MKTVRLTDKEMFALRELFDFIAPSYGDTFNREELNECIGINEEECNVLYGKLCAADNGPSADPTEAEALIQKNKEVLAELQRVVAELTQG